MLNSGRELEWWLDITPEQDLGWMGQALEIARSSDGARIGALIVHQGQVIATGQSLVRPKCDPTAHAEVNAIRRAAKEVGCAQINNAVLYSTLEPCGMCLNAAAWAGMRMVVFGADYTMVAEDYSVQEKFNSFDYRDCLKSDLVGRPNMLIRGGCRAEECAALLLPPGCNRKT